MKKSFNRDNLAVPTIENSLYQWEEYTSIASSTLLGKVHRFWIIPKTFSVLRKCLAMAELSCVFIKMMRKRKKV